MTDETPAPSPPKSRRNRWIALGVVAVLGLAAAGYFFGAPDEDGKREAGGIAPDFSLPAVAGDGEVALASLRGKPVVLNFFASWCVPCRKEMPALQAVSAKAGDRVAFLGIDHKDNRDGGRKLLEDTGVRYPSGYDPEGAVATQFALFGMPTTVFIGADGRILDKHTGELSEADLEDYLKDLFGITL